MKWSRKPIVLSFLIAPCAMAGPDLELNPQTGFVESVDTEAGSSYVRHVVDEGQGGQRRTTLISSAAGLDPRLAIKTNGSTWAVWWQDGQTDEVRGRVRSLGSETWGTILLLSSAGEESREPEIVHQGSTAWIAYQIHGASDVSIAVQSIIDGPEPIPQRTVIASTTFSGDVDALIHSESGHIWTTWVDSTTYVGWSEYNPSTELWNLPQYRSYVSTTVGTIRKSIRDTVVLGQ